MWNKSEKLGNYLKKKLFWCLVNINYCIPHVNISGGYYGLVVVMPPYCITPYLTWFIIYWKPTAVIFMYLIFLRVNNICIWYWLECEMGLSQHKCLNPAWAWKARAGFGYECWDNPSSTKTNTLCIFSHVTSILNMFRILLWAHLWHVYRDVFISVLVS